MSFWIRPMEARDVEQVGRIEQEAFGCPWSEETFLAMLQRSYSLALVAETEKQVAGFCVLTLLGEEGNIDHVAVAKACRGQGMASALVAQILELGSAAGVRDFTLEVRVSNEAAIHVYEKLGFVSEGIRPRFYEKPTEDANIMWRRKQ